MMLKKINEQLKMQEASELFMDEVQKGMGQFLAPDVERIKKVEKQARNTVYDAVKNTGGDLKRFYMMGGHKILREYRNSIAQSKEVANAIKSKKQLEMYAKDMSEGKIARNVTIETTKGSGEYAEMDMQQAITAFNDGKLEVFQYNGAEDPVKLASNYFSSKYDGNNPYKTNNRVTKDSYVAAFIEQGQSKSIAEKRAKELVVGVDEETGKEITEAFWGVKDYDFAGYSRMMNMSNGFGTRSSSGKTTKMQKNAEKSAAVVQQMVNLIPQDKWKSADWLLEDGTPTKQFIGTYQAPMPDWKKVANASGIYFGANGEMNTEAFMVQDFFNMSTGKMLNLKQHQYDLGGLTPGAIKIVKDPNDPKKTMAFLEAQLHVPEEYVENVLEWETGSSLWMGTNTKAGKAHRDMSWSEEEKLGYDTDMRELTVGVYVPMDEYGISRINSMIDFKPSEVAGSPVFEDYYSNVYQRPEGTIPAQNLEGNIRYGSVPQGSPYTSSTRQASNFSNTDEFQKAFSALPPEIQEKVALNLAQSQQQQQSQPVQSENPIMDVSLQPVMKEIMTQG